jgi:hypothetical protein
MGDRVSINPAYGIATMRSRVMLLGDETFMATPGAEL